MVKQVFYRRIIGGWHVQSVPRWATEGNVANVAVHRGTVFKSPMPQHSTSETFSRWKYGREGLRLVLALAQWGINFRGFSV